MAEIFEFVAKASFGLMCISLIAGFAGIFVEDRPQGPPAWQEAAWMTVYWSFGVAMVCLVLVGVLH